jgi:hypothetical protein
LNWKKELRIAKVIGCILPDILIVMRRKWLRLRRVVLKGLPKINSNQYMEELG